MADNGLSGFVVSIEDGPSDQFGFDDSEEHPDNGVTATIILSDVKTRMPWRRGPAAITACVA